MQHNIMEQIIEITFRYKVTLWTDETAEERLKTEIEDAKEYSHEIAGGDLILNDLKVTGKLIE